MPISQHAACPLYPARPEAVELTRWFANEDSLPAASALMRFASLREFSPEELMKLVDERITEAKVQIENAARKELRPRLSEIQSLLDRLGAYQSTER